MRGEGISRGPGARDRAADACRQFRVRSHKVHSDGSTFVWGRPVANTESVVSPECHMGVTVPLINPALFQRGFRFHRAVTNFKNSFVARPGGRALGQTATIFLSGLGAESERYCRACMP